MPQNRTNILVNGLLKTGSSALIDLLREYDNLQIIPGEFDDYRAPGLVADQLDEEKDENFPNKIPILVRKSLKQKILFTFFRVLNLKILFPLKDQWISSYNRLIRYELLRKLDERLNSNQDSNIKYSKKWITGVTDIYVKNEDYVLFNNSLQSVNDISIWKKVFDPFKLIIVYRNPKDQLADIIKFGYLYGAYGGPEMNLGEATLESIYGRNRAGALAFHIEGVKKNYAWVDSLKKQLNSDQLLLIDFEGLVENYDQYKLIIGNYIGNISHQQQSNKLFFDPEVAKKSIDIYENYLSLKEIELLDDLQNWYDNTIELNNKELKKYSQHPH